MKMKKISSNAFRSHLKNGSFLSDIGATISTESETHRCSGFACDIPNLSQQSITSRRRL
jgi:hypothetical protein